MSQENKLCPICGEIGHSKFYCKKKPFKPILSKAKKTTKPKKPTRSQLVKKLDEIFSKFIRLDNSDVNGMTTCVTCGLSKPWGQMQNGHYFSRGFKPTRWDEDNCHVQCYRCNCLLKGNYIEYTLYMAETYSLSFIKQLKEKAHSGEKLFTYQLQEMIDEYSKKVSELIKEKGNDKN